MTHATHPQPPQRGYILLPVVLALALLAAIAWLINREGAIHADMVTNTTEAVMAGEVVRAGLAHASWGIQDAGCAGDMAMASVPFGQPAIGSYTATATTADGGSTLHALPATEDAWFRSDQPTVNNGTNQDLHLRLETLGTEYALARFDLSTIPAGSRINSASLWFYVKGGGQFPEGALTLHQVTEAWTETDATWDSMSNAWENKPLAVIPARSEDNSWVRVNLTTEVQTRVNSGEPDFDIMIRPNAPGTHARFVSREGPADQQPRLDVVVGSGPGSPANLSVTGTLAGTPSPSNDIRRTLTRSGTPVYQPLISFYLQPGVATGKDTILDSGAPEDNHGTTKKITFEQFDTFRLLLGFDLSGLPRGAIVTSAGLGLYLEGASGSAVPGDLSVHRVTRSWTEGTGSGGITLDGASWNSRDGSNAWTTPGGDHDPDPVSTTLVETILGWYNWDVSSLARSWADGTQPNHGLMLRSEGIADKLSLTLSESSFSQSHPRLLLTLACECGIACAIPRGFGRLALVVAQPATLTASEATRKSLFESWGYRVNLIGQGEAQSAFDGAAASNDVMYVSGTVSPATVGSKLTALTVGIVNEHGGLNNTLGISNNAVTAVSTQFEIVDTSHYITLPFPPGELEIYDAAMEQQVISGGHAPGVQTLAESGGDSSLAVVEKGTMLKSGTPAPGRRVALPLGTDAGFNWDYLNSNGRLLLQRALQWATGITETITSGFYRDEFKKFVCITAEDYTDSIGTLDWSTQPWIEIGEDNDSCSGGVRLNDDLGSTRLRIAVPDKGIMRAANLNSFSSAWLQFDYRRENFDSLTDMLSVAVSSDGGLNWSEVARFSGPATDSAYLGAAVDISAHAGPATVVRFMTLNTHTNASEMAFFDNVQIGKTAPAGTQTILFVVPDAAAPGPQDSTKRVLMQSWGYRVELISAAAAQADYDAAVDSADIVYISEEVLSSEVGTKLRDAAIGIVNEETALVDEFGITDNRATDIETDTNVVDSAHYITSVFGPGIITLASSDTELNQLTGTLAPGLDSLTETSAVASLATIPAGGLLYDGGTAAGRRVQLPWGANGFDIDLLTVDGLTVMRRAIEWAGGAGADTGGGGGGGGGGCATSFRDEFNEKLYSNNDGSLNWAGDWVEGGEDTDPTGNEIRIETDIDDFQLRLKKENRSVTRPLDMSGYASATLTFDSRLDGVADGMYLAIEASSNGTDWTEVGRFTGPADEVVYSPNSFDITPWISATAAIRFVTGPANGKEDRFFLDNVDICVN